MTDDRTDEEKYPNRHAHGEPTYRVGDYENNYKVAQGQQMWSDLGFTVDGEFFRPKPLPDGVSAIQSPEAPPEVYFDVSAPFDDACADTLNDLHRLLCQKQDDYGSGNILHSVVDAETALLVRLSDKFARLANLRKKNREAKNETVRDTVVDIAGYAILLLMVMDGTFPDE